MIKLGFVTDSPSDLPDDLTQQYKIEVVPSILVLEGLAYLDGIQITRTEFYNRLPTLRVSPTTAAPACDDFSARFQKLLEAGCEHILGIFTSEKLTATANLARKAAEDFGGKVSVLESGSLSMGSGYQVLAAVEAGQQGLSLQDVLASVQSTRERLKVFAALDTIEYVRRSGRVPRAVAALGGLMRIKPIVELHEGVVKPVGAPRTSRKATERLLDLLVELGPLERMCILHTNAELRAQEFLSSLSSIQDQYLPDDIRIVSATSVIGTHIGPNGLGFAAVKKKL